MVYGSALNEGNTGRTIVQFIGMDLFFLSVDILRSRISNVC
jgi:hypothetical protein